jgi:hypothetical protein
VEGFLTSRHGGVEGLSDGTVRLWLVLRNCKVDGLNFLWTRNPLVPAIIGGVERQRSLIAAIVNNVSYSKEVKRRGTLAWTKWHDTCIELHCVMDADKLDALGAFGIFRCAAFSGSRNIPLFLRADEELFKNSAVGHFHDKLFRLESMMMTQVGRKVARKRTALMRDFIEHLNDEAELRDFEE